MPLATPTIALVPAAAAAVTVVPNNAPAAAAPTANGTKAAMTLKQQRINSILDLCFTVVNKKLSYRRGTA